MEKKPLNSKKAALLTRRLIKKANGQNTPIGINLKPGISAYRIMGHLSGSGI